VFTQPSPFWTYHAGVCQRATKDRVLGACLAPRSQRIWQAISVTMQAYLSERHYGFVWKNGPELSVFAFNGLSRTVACPAERVPIAIETWFGLGAAEFRIASLHPFEAVGPQTAQSERPTVRFGFVGARENV
jgi:hypothetical protein